MISIAGGIAAGTLWRHGNDGFIHWRCIGLVDTGSGVDSVLLSGSADSITLTGALTSTSVTAGAGNDSILVKANVASGYLDVSAAGNDTLNCWPPL